MKKKKANKLNIYDFHLEIELAVQRMVLIKKALGIQVKDYDKELDWVTETFKELNPKGETSCGYLTIKTWLNEDKKQKINFYFELAER